MISEFKGDYYFLSNFYPFDISINNYIFHSNEAAYQAFKSKDPKDWSRFQYYTASIAKKEGQKLKLRSEWNDIRLDVMTELIDIKFRRTSLMMKLINTRPHELVEGNYWGDTYWGICKGKGENHLGKILMNLREEIQGDFPW